MPTGHRLVLVTACAAEFMVVLDASVVNVALPAIRRALALDPATLSWVVNAYALVFAGFLLLGGRLTDRLGTRRAFAGGLVVFVAAGAVGGLATGPAVLVGARAVQALGAAVLAPASLAALTTTIPEGPGRTRALAAWTALASAGGAAGSLLGGVLSEFLTWRATLLVNVPLGVLVALAAHRALPRTDAEHGGAREGTDGRSRLDVPGAAGATAATAALALAVTLGPERGWTDPAVLGAFAVAAAVLPLFVLHEVRWSPAPLLPLRMLRLPTVRTGNLAVLLAGACLMPMWYFLSIYFQQGLGLGPWLAGLGFLPHTLITVVVGARVAPWLLDRVRARSLVVAGCLVTAGGFAWQATVAPGDDYLSGALGPAVVASIGGGLLNTPLTTVVTSGVDRADAGAASGLMNTGKQLGGALGLAGLVALASATVDAPSGGPVAAIASTATGFAAMAVVLVVVAVVALLLPATGALSPNPDGAASRRRSRSGAPPRAPR